VDVDEKAMEITNTAVDMVNNTDILEDQRRVERKRGDNTDMSQEPKTVPHRGP